MNDVPVSPRDVFRALFRHQKKIAATFVVLFGSIVLVSLLWPRSYSSEGSLYVRVGHEMATLDPTASTGETLHVQKSEQTQVNTVMKILESRQLAERVVKRVGVEPILSGSLGSPPGQVARRSLVSRVKSVVKYMLHPVVSFVRGFDGALPDWDRAVEIVQKSTSISAPKDSTIVTVRCIAGTPEMAQKLAEIRLEEFQTEHLRLTQTTGSFEFFEQQSEQLAVELAEASQLLRDRKNEFRLLSVEGKQQALEGERSNVRVQLLNTQGLFTAAEARVAQLQRQLEAMSAMIVTTELSGVESMALSQMRSELFRFEADYQGLSAKFSPEHHQVREVKKKIDELRQMILAEQSAVTQKTSGINPNYQRIEYELAEARANVESQRSQLHGWEAERQRIESELQDVNDQAIEIRELERRLAETMENHQLCQARLEQARLNKELHDRGISSLNVVQDPVVMHQHLGPKKKFAFAMGLVVATLGSLGMAFVAEVIDQSIRSTDQLSQQLGLPVLACLPAMRSHRLSYLMGRQQWLGKNDTSMVKDLCSADEEALENEYIH